MATDKEKLKFELALHGMTLVEEPSCNPDYTYYCGIMMYGNGDRNGDRCLIDELYNFSDNEQSAFEEVYKKWKMRKNF